ncbi:MAG: hypothetical protein AAF355_06255 [Myxococcota bacterium]
MNPARRILFSIVLLGMLSLGMTHASPLAAQEVQITGPLAGAPACRSCRIYRRGRISLTPMVGFSLRDEYNRSVFTGGSAEYHVLDWLGFGAFFMYSPVQLATSLTDEVESQGVTTDRNRLSLPSSDNFSDQIGSIDFIIAPQVLFIPLRGKLALFQRIFVDTDFYIHLGLSIVGLTERAHTEAGICDEATDACLASQSARSSRVTMNATFGAGIRLYINDFIAINAEWRGLPFAWNTSGTDESGSEDGDFPDGVIDSDDRISHFNQMVSLGVSIYLPSSAAVSN